MFKQLLLSLAIPFLLFGQQSTNPNFRRATPPKMPDPTLPWNEIREAHLIDASSGWVLQGHKLLLTDLEGSTFKDITPPVGEKGMINAVHFFDKSNGWAAIQGPPTQPDLAVSVTIAATSDGGKSWILAPVGVDDDFLLTNYVGNANFDFVSPEVGFGIFQTITSSASSAAALFGTSDGGRTWDFITGHIGYGQIRFITPNIGWALGGMRGDDLGSLHKSIDGGVNWIEKQYPFPPGVKEKWAMNLTVPSFSNLQNGVLEGTYFSKTTKEQMIAHYSTSDEGNTWKLEGVNVIQGRNIPQMGSKTLDHSSPPEVSLSGAYLMIQSSTSKHLTSLPLADKNPQRLTIQSAEFSDPSHGWIVVNADLNPLSGRHSRSALISTSDGGAHLKTILTDVDLTASSVGHESGVTTGSSIDIQPWTWWGLDACTPDPDTRVVNSL